MSKESNTPKGVNRTTPTKTWSRRPQHPLRSLENSYGLKAAGKEVPPKLSPSPSKSPSKVPPPSNMNMPCAVSTTDMNGLDSGNNSESVIGEIRIRSEPFTENYTTDGEIGRGKFAVVRKCKHKHTGRDYAAKFLRKRRKGKDCRQDIVQEITMLELALRHKRLVDLKEVYETSHEIIIVTEYAAGGELFHHIEMEDRFAEQDTIRLMREILEGLVYLHKHNIVHCDVKPQNILLTEPLPRGHIKLCDLGFARRVNSGEDVRDLIGTPDYVAPEVLQYEPINTACDMWSVGVLTYVMLTGCSPFAGDNIQETYLNISQVNLDFPDDIFSDISADGIDFISSLLVKEPEERLTAAESLMHPWLRQEDPHTPKSPFGSPLGCRRALTPPSPDCSSVEKKCKCDADALPPARVPELPMEKGAEDVTENAMTSSSSSSSTSSPKVITRRESTAFTCDVTEKENDASLSNQDENSSSSSSGILINKVEPGLLTITKVTKVAAEESALTLTSGCKVTC